MSRNRKTVEVFTYVIQEESLTGNTGVGKVKIGHTQNVQKRRQNLQGGNPKLLRLLAYTSGGSAEQWLHDALAVFRIRGKESEWFVPTATVAIAVWVEIGARIDSSDDLSGMFEHSRNRAIPVDPHGLAHARYLKLNSWAQKIYDSIEAFAEQTRIANEEHDHRLQANRRRDWMKVSQKKRIRWARQRSEGYPL